MSDRPEQILCLTLGGLHQAAVVLCHSVAHILQEGLTILLIRDVTLLLIDQLTFGLLCTGTGLVLSRTLLLIDNLAHLSLNCLTNILIHVLAASTITIS